MALLLQLFHSRKAFVTDWGDLFKGLIVGFIAGALLFILGCKGVVKIPFVP